MAKVMGYKGLLYYGAKGSTASTLIEARTDCSLEITPETGSTTSAGDGTTVPIETGEATSIDGKITFKTIVDTTDAVIAAIGAAAATGTAIALKFVPYSGSAIFDADCIVSFKVDSPLKGEAAIDISVEKLSASDRDPVIFA